MSMILSDGREAAAHARCEQFWQYTLSAAAVIGLSASPAYAAQPTAGDTPAAGPAAATTPGPLIAMQTGRLLVIRVPSRMPYPITSPPNLYERFNADRFIDKTAHLMRPQVPLGELRMLGVLRVT